MDIGYWTFIEHRAEETQSAESTDPIEPEVPEEGVAHIHAIINDLHRQRVVVLDERDSDRHQVLAARGDIIGDEVHGLVVMVLPLHQSDTRVLQEALQDVLAALLVVIRVLDVVSEDELVGSERLRYVMVFVAE